MNQCKSVCLVIMGILIAFSSADIIRGTVTDALDRTPVANARVALDATHYTLSGADGTYELNTSLLQTIRTGAGPVVQSVRWDAASSSIVWTGYPAGGKFTVISVLGKTVISQSFVNKPSGRFDLGRLPMGAYVVTFSSPVRHETFRVLVGSGSMTLAAHRGTAVLDGTVRAKAAVNNLSFSKNGYFPAVKTVNGSSDTANMVLQRDSVLVITNETVTARFVRASGAFTARSTAAPIDFVKSANLFQTGGSAKVTEAPDSVFGAGQAIRIDYTNGNADLIMLFPGQPFLMFRKMLSNRGARDTIVPKIQTLAATLGMPRAASSLKANGTAGLTAVNGHSGSYTYLSIADPAVRNGVVAGWITQTRGGGVVFSTIAGTDAVVTAQIDYGKLRIRPGQSAQMELFALGYFNDARIGLETYADAIAKAYAITLRPCPTVYCTWYEGFTPGTEASVLQRSQWLNANLVKFGFKVAQIDDGWQVTKRMFNDYNHTGPYPSGMKYTADNIKANNLTAGLWFMPFAGDAGTSASWYLKDDAGAKFEETAWAGITLDPTYPAVKTYIQTISNLISNTWGYKYFKVDGMYTGMGAGQCYINDGYQTACWRGDDPFFKAKFYDSTLTNFDVYRQAWKSIRQAAGDVFIMGCCVSQNMYTLGGSFGIMDAMRIGPDNDNSWNGVTSGLWRGGQRYFFGNRVFYIDPDPVYLNVPTLEARTSCSFVAITGFMNTTSEVYANATAANIDLFKRVIPHHGLKTVRPADYYDRAMPGIWLLTDTTKTVRRDVIGLFNFNGTTTWTETVTMSKVGLSATQQYVGFDFWANAFVAPWSGNLSIVLAAKACRILAVRPVSENPILISTSRHVTQGIIDMVDENWNAASKTLSGTSSVIAGDPYELRIVAAKTGGTWTVATASVSAADQTAGVTIGTPAQTGTGVRVTINSTVSREVKWSVVFN